MEMTADLAALQARIDDAPFHRWLGVRAIAVGADGIELEASWREEFSGHSSLHYVHGGIISSIIDLAGYFAVCAAHATPRATADLFVDFHRPILASHFRVTSAAGHRSANACCAQAEIWRPDGKLAASGRGRYSLSEADLKA